MKGAGSLAERQQVQCKMTVTSMARKNSLWEAAGCNFSTASIALPKTGSKCNVRCYRKRGPFAQGLHVAFNVHHSGTEHAEQLLLGLCMQGDRCCIRILTAPWPG